MKDDGSVWAWGQNDLGQLGIGTTGDDRSSPTQVLNLSDVVAIDAGDNHSLAMLADHTVRALGLNWKGQLEDGTTVDRNVATDVVGLPEVVQVVGSENHSVAVGFDGSVRCSVSARASTTRWPCWLRRADPR